VFIPSSPKINLAQIDFIGVSTAPSLPKCKFTLNSIIDKLTFGDDGSKFIVKKKSLNRLYKKKKFQ